jgi:hypothetical protein
MATRIPVGPMMPPRDLASATDARTTRLRRPRPSSKKAARQAWYQSRRSFSEGGSVPFVLRTGGPLTSCLALRSPCAPALPRPPHPAPRFVTIGRNAPLHRGGMGKTMLLICPTAQARRLRHIGTTGNLRMTRMCRLPVGHRLRARRNKSGTACVFL